MAPELMWLIPAVIVGSWIVWGILSAKEQEPRKTWRPPTVEPGEAPPERPARPVTDVDRFLEEINRLRRRSAEERPETAQAPPVRRPAPRPVRRETPRPRPAPVFADSVPVRRVPEAFRPQPVPQVVIPLEAIPVVRPAHAPRDLPAPAGRIAAPAKSTRPVKTRESRCSLGPGLPISPIL